VPALAQLLVEGRRFGEPLRLVLEGIGIAGPGAAEPLGQNLVGQAGVLGGGGQRLMADGKGFAVMQIIVHALPLALTVNPGWRRTLDNSLLPADCIR
jgi:hypothetical protein